MGEVRDALELARRIDLFKQYLTSLLSHLEKMDIYVKKKAIQDVGDLANQHPNTPKLGFVLVSKLFSRPAPSTHRAQPADLAHLYSQVADSAGEKDLLAGLFN